MTNVLAVTLDEVLDSFEGTLDTDQLGWGQRMVDRAVRLLIQRIPSIPDRVAAGSLDRDFVVDKVAEAAHRVYRNPEGMESEAEGEYNYKLRTIMASGNVWYPDADLIDLGFVKSEVPRTVYSNTSRGWGFPS